MILVTGMHRSGTSLVAMTMEGLGVSFGDHSAFYAADEWNAKGYFERRDVMDINSRMITGFDRTRSPVAALVGQARYLLEPSIDDVVARGSLFAKDMRAIAAEPDIDAVKDPRFCLTWSAWAENIDIDACVVCIRHPFEVADSLRRRQRIPTSLGVRFWRYHMRSLRDRTPEKMVVVDLHSLITRPADELEALVNALGLGIGTEEAVRRFESSYSPGLTRVSEATERSGMDEATQDLWDWLIGHSPRRIAESR